jgi:hypothetical protein
MFKKNQMHPTPCSSLQPNTMFSSFYKDAKAQLMDVWVGLEKYVV